jgi:hypothetical protein
LEKPGFQKRTAELVRKTGQTGWLVQATLTKGQPGFVSDLGSLAQRLGVVPREVRSAARTVSHLSKRLQTGT